ncbi:MAG TPA: hypothetical protein PKY81_00430 [bacterium]|nr:hypothetical protein [bacterium]
MKISNLIFLAVLTAFLFFTSFLKPNLYADSFNQSLWKKYLDFISVSPENIEYEEWLHNNASISEIPNGLNLNSDKKKFSILETPEHTGVAADSKTDSFSKSFPASDFVSKSDTVLLNADFVSKSDTVLLNADFASDFDTASLNADFASDFDTASLNADFASDFDTASLNADFVSDLNFNLNAEESANNQTPKLQNLNEGNAYPTKKAILNKIDEHDNFIRKKKAKYIRIPAALLCIISLL